MRVEPLLLNLILTLNSTLGMMHSSYRTDRFLALITELTSEVTGSGSSIFASKSARVFACYRSLKTLI